MFKIIEPILKSVNPKNAEVFRKKEWKFSELQFDVLDVFSGHDGNPTREQHIELDGVLLQHVPERFPVPQDGERPIECIQAWAGPTGPFDF